MSAVLGHAMALSKMKPSMRRQAAVSAVLAQAAERAVFAHSPAMAALAPAPAMLALAARVPRHVCGASSVSWPASEPPSPSHQAWPPYPSPQPCRRRCPFEPHLHCDPNCQDQRSRPARHQRHPPSRRNRCSHTGRPSVCRPLVWMAIRRQVLARRYIVQQLSNPSGCNSSASLSSKGRSDTLWRPAATCPSTPNRAHSSLTALHYNVAPS